MSDKLQLFEAYAEYVGCESVAELNTYGFAIHICEDCDVEIPVSASDPQAYGPVLCPDCGGLCEREQL